MYGIYNVTPNGFTSWFNFSKKIIKKNISRIKNLISPIYLREFNRKLTPACAARLKTTSGLNLIKIFFISLKSSKLASKK